LLVGWWLAGRTLAVGIAHFTVGARSASAASAAATAAFTGLAWFTSFAGLGFVASAIGAAGCCWCAFGTALGPRLATFATFIALATTARAVATLRARSAVRALLLTAGLHCARVRAWQVGIRQHGLAFGVKALALCTALAVASIAATSAASTASTSFATRAPAIATTFGAAFTGFAAGAACVPTAAITSF
jgi:hypothetical protein